MPYRSQVWQKQWTLYNFAESCEINRVPVSHTTTGEFTPPPLGFSVVVCGEQ
jgi:hypothetical protein